MRRILSNTLLFLIGTVVLFLLMEGTASSLLLFARVFNETPVRERSHTEYDAELGWINVPNARIDDMYGPGRFFSTNSQRFRGSEEYTEEVPEGKIRLICTGDSFTLGFGVSDDSTWVRLLELEDSRLETVNMGQGGYGIDQAHLWFMREKERFDHQIHLFTFITWDFRRMQTGSYHGYGKPVIALEGDSLVVRNVPVPRTSYRAPGLTRAVQQLGHLRLVELLRKSMNRIIGDRGRVEHKDEESRAVAAKIFEKLQQTHDAANRSFVLVHLPSKADLASDDYSRPWRDFLHREAKRNGWHLIDLIDVFHDYPCQETESLFRTVDRHFTEKGNAWVAVRLYERMLAIPEIAARLPGSSGG
jgi:hypothetical protein